MTDVTFGVALRGSVSLDAFGEAVRRADALGCDVIAAPDHLGSARSIYDADRCRGNQRARAATDPMS